ncbi:hypothetical protein GF371_04525 [Candidatus Woesearchaeota archaeon]|nr:hypothetical protein [Candidatus Woesearchaeota archaeon]
MDFTIFSIIGILGLILIAVSWVPETLRTIKTRKSGLEWHFNLIYVIGSFCLIVYSVYIWDYIFMALNAAAFVLSSINLFYTLFYG